ncbi:MAG: sulfite exporter TauE/SafE family protein [Gemmataceae bacterium]|nr:sulfite exporter TauE/SafE family protein [Gemmataceae bacterium]
MTVLTLTLLLFLGAIVAGLLGALTGLGGGVILLPLLTLVFGVDMHYAIGATLISVIATSSGSAAAYVKEGYSNVRVGMFLEVATTFGAVCGAFLGDYVPISAIAIIFGIVLLISAYLSARPRTGDHLHDQPDPLATRLRMNSTYPTPGGLKSYYVRGVPLGWMVMYIAGLLSGLLGIGSGALKVLAMDQIMRLPFKVSTTTSNFMIGVTAAASAGIYLSRGYIDPGLSMPVMLGVLLGATLGAKVLNFANTRYLRIVFTVVIVALAVQMIFHGVVGDLK